MKQLLNRILEWSQGTAPVHLSFGYVDKNNMCRSGIVLRTAPPVIIKKLARDSMVDMLALENDGLHIISVEEATSNTEKERCSYDYRGSADPERIGSVPTILVTVENGVVRNVYCNLEANVMAYIIDTDGTGIRLDSNQEFRDIIACMKKLDSIEYRLTECEVKK